MKKLVLVAAILSVIFLFCGCGQELDFTVYNCGVNVGSPGEWLHVIIEWEDGGSSSFYPTSRALTLDDINLTNSYSFKVKEDSTVRITGGGIGIKADAVGVTTLASYSIGDTSQVVYGGFLETPHW